MNFANYELSTFESRLGHLITGKLVKTDSFVWVWFVAVAFGQSAETG